MPPYLGESLSHRTADKWQGKLAPHLHAGEQVWALFRTASTLPPLDGVAVTSSRVLGFASMELSRKPPRVDVPHGRVVAADVTSRMTGKGVNVRTLDGDTRSLGVLNPAAAHALRHYVDTAAEAAQRPAPVAPPVAAAVAVVRPTPAAGLALPRSVPVTDSTGATARLEMTETALLFHPHGGAASVRVAYADISSFSLAPRGGRHELSLGTGAGATPVGLLALADAEDVQRLLLDRTSRRSSTAVPLVKAPAVAPHPVAAAHAAPTHTAPAPYPPSRTRESTNTGATVLGAMVLVAIAGFGLSQCGSDDAPSAESWASQRSAEQPGSAEGGSGSRGSTSLSEIVTELERSGRVVTGDDVLFLKLVEADGYAMDTVRAGTYLDFADTTCDALDNGADGAALIEALVPTGQDAGLTRTNVEGLVHGSVGIYCQQYYPQLPQ